MGPIWGNLKDVCPQTSFLSSVSDHGIEIKAKAIAQPEFELEPKDRY